MEYDNLKPVKVTGNEKQKRLTVPKSYQNYIKVNDTVVILKYEDYKQISIKENGKLKEENKKLRQQVKDLENELITVSNKVNSANNILLGRLFGNLEQLQEEKSKLLENNLLLTKDTVNAIEKDLNKQYMNQLNNIENKYKNLSIWNRIKNNINFIDFKPIPVDTEKYISDLGTKMEKQSNNLLNINMEDLNNEFNKLPNVIDVKK